MAQENPLWMLGLLSGQGGVNPDTYSKAQLGGKDARAIIEAAKSLGVTPDEYIRLQATANAQISKDVSANLGFTASQTDRGDYKLQNISPRAGVNVGGLLDAGVSADVNRFAGYGQSDASPSMRYDLHANAPIAGGLLTAGGDYSTRDGATYDAEYGRDLGGGRLSASVSRNPKYNETMALLNWMKRF